MITQRILQLNVWMGKVEGNLRRLLEQNDFDMICLQEVLTAEEGSTREHLARLCFDLEAIQKASRLPHVFFSPNWGGKLANGTMQLGNAILSRTPFISTESEFAHGAYNGDTILGKTVGNNLNYQIAKLENGLTVVNHHGYWQPNPIGNEESVKSMQRVADAIRPLAEDSPLVMCGDLNIEAASPAMRPLDFLVDLTAKNQVKNTLSGLKYDGEVACDHILVNDAANPVDFLVRQELASDHLALEATIEF